MTANLTLDQLKVLEDRSGRTTAHGERTFFDKEKW